MDQEVDNAKRAAWRQPRQCRRSVVFQGVSRVRDDSCDEGQPQPDPLQWHPADVSIRPRSVTHAGRGGAIRPVSAPRDEHRPDSHAAASGGQRQLTKTFGLPVTLVSTTGPNAPAKFAEAGQNPLPADLENFCLANEILFPVFDALPLRLAALYEQVTVVVPAAALTVTRIGLVLLWPVTFTGWPLPSLTVTWYGRFLTLMLLTVIPETLVVHFEKDWAVSDSFAVPGLTGLVLTVALNFAALQVSFSVPSEDTAEVPLMRFALRTAPTFTAV